METSHFDNDVEICFNKETDLGAVMERNMEVEAFGGLICKLYLVMHFGYQTKKYSGKRICYRTDTFENDGYYA